MFKIAKDHSFTWPVDVYMPVDGGRTDHKKFVARFRPASVSRSAEVLAAVREASLERLDELDLLKEVLIGWEGVADEDGAEIPFSAEARDTLIDIVYVRAGLLDAYVKATAGKAVKAKN